MVSNKKLIFNCLAIIVIIAFSCSFNNPFLDADLKKSTNNVSSPNVSSPNDTYNLLFNGDFELGNIGFYTDYNYQGGSSGSYYISNNPRFQNSLWVSYYDHTSGSGNMMIIDGATTNNYRVWEQSISVDKNSTYRFAGWIANCYASNPAILVVKINDMTVGSTINGTFGTWSEFSIIWSSNDSTIAKIQIFNLTDRIAGNDFTLDDLSFVKL
jgi:hypothetical protein